MFAPRAPTIRTPLLWAAIQIALLTPFAFLAPVFAPPDPNCTDWIWCDLRYVGVEFRPAPSMHPLAAVVPPLNMLIAFLAARVAARGPNPRMRWFLAAASAPIPLLAILFLIAPVASPTHFWVSTSTSYLPAVITFSLEGAVLYGILLGAPAALLLLLGAAIWRALRRPPIS